MKTKKPWFRSKRYGWGWGLPLTWQGWIVFTIYLFIVMYLVYGLNGRSYFLLNTPMHILLPFFIATIIFIIIASITGEKPQWRWGGKKIYDKEKRKK